MAHAPSSEDEFELAGSTACDALAVAPGSAADALVVAPGSAADAPGPRRRRRCPVPESGGTSLAVVCSAAALRPEAVTAEPAGWRCHTAVAVCLVHWRLQTVGRQLQPQSQREADVARQGGGFLVRVEGFALERYSRPKLLIFV